MKQNCVGLHLRTFHTDAEESYVENRFGREVMIKYFQDAIDFFPKDYIFLVFSDDMNYCVELLPVKDKKRFFLIRYNSRHIDLYLMSFCKHQIVSPDSTFSWWGAWLNKNPSKIIIRSKLEDKTPKNDYIPEEWIAL